MNSKILCLLLSGVLALGLGGCRKEQTEPEKTEKKEISIPMILTVDPSTGNRNEDKVIEKFNQAYKGTYYVDVKWIMETEEEYRKNLKRLNVTDQLPAVITDLRMLPSFYQMMIKEERIEDLAPYIENDEEWKSMIEPSVLKACSEEDGSIYLAPLSTAMFACSGVFWNQELFQKAGIEKFPETWEEFWECCDRLENAGIVPLALHTEGTAWAPMLLATAELADSQEGADFMEKLYPESYQNSSGLRLAETLKKLFSYTTKDALHTDFDVSYRNFISEKTAMVPNGYWMIDQIPEDMVDKIRFSPFPGNKLVGSPETFGWAVVSSYSQEVKEGAIEFLKFRTMLNKSEKEDFLEEQASYENQIVKDYVQAYKENPQLVPNYQVKWNSVLQEETLGEALPKLVKGEISPEKFTQMEDQSIQEFEEER